MRLVLASASPRRAELLRAAGFSFDTLVVEIDERPRSGEEPREYVRRLATEKSAAARASIAGATAQEVVVLGADTAVVLENDILGKPKDDRENAAMLRRLSGRRHQVMTGVSVRGPASELWAVEVTEVAFAELSDEEIAWYVASGEGRDKAGGYAIQGLGSRFIPWIHGSYSNVVGLPVVRVNDLLKLLGTSYSLQ